MKLALLVVRREHTRDLVCLVNQKRNVVANTFGRCLSEDCQVLGFLVVASRVSEDLRRLGIQDQAQVFILLNQRSESLDRIVLVVSVSDQVSVRSAGMTRYS